MTRQTCGWLCAVIVVVMGWGVGSRAVAEEALEGLRLVDVKEVRLGEGWEVEDMRLLPFDEVSMLALWTVWDGNPYDGEYETRVALVRVEDGALGKVETVEGRLVQAVRLGGGGIVAEWRKVEGWSRYRNGGGLWSVIDPEPHKGDGLLHADVSDLERFYPLAAGAVGLWLVGEDNDIVPRVISREEVRQWPTLRRPNPEARYDNAKSAWAVAECSETRWLLHHDSKQFWAQLGPDLPKPPTSWSLLPNPPDAKGVPDKLTTACDGQVPYVIAQVGVRLWRLPLATFPVGVSWEPLNEGAEEAVSLSHEGAVLKHAAVDQGASLLVWRAITTHAALGPPTLLKTLGPDEPALAACSTPINPMGAQSTPFCLLATGTEGAQKLALGLPPHHLSDPQTASPPPPSPLASLPVLSEEDSDVDSTTLRDALDRHCALALSRDHVKGCPLAYEELEWRMSRSKMTLTSVEIDTYSEVCDKDENTAVMMRIRRDVAGRWWVTFMRIHDCSDCTGG